MAQVVIAVRGGPEAKSRCAAALAPADRAELAGVMLQDMLTAIEAAQQATATWVVTPTASLAQLARDRGVRVIAQDPAGDLNRAFRLALAQVGERAPYDAVVLLPGDLPLLRPSELDAAITLARSHAVVLAPAYDGGTGAIVLRAGTFLAPAFGPGSFGRHAAAAKRRGLSCAVMRADSLSQDADRPEDLLAIVRAGPTTRTADFLRSRLAPRMSS